MKIDTKVMKNILKYAKLSADSITMQYIDEALEEVEGMEENGFEYMYFQFPTSARKIERKDSSENESSDKDELAKMMSKDLFTAAKAAEKEGNKEDAAKMKADAMSILSDIDKFFAELGAACLGPAEDEEDDEACDFDSDFEEDDDDTECQHELKIHVFGKGHADDFVGKCPVVFTGTTDFSFKTGIGKHYVDKYLPLWRLDAPDLSRGDGSLPVGGVARVENGDAKFYILMPKGRSDDKIESRILHDTMVCLADKIKADGVTEIAMPPIFCGHERFEWNNISRCLKKIFEDHGYSVSFIYE